MTDHLHPTTGESMHADALNELPFLARDYHNGQTDDLYAVGSSGWVPVDLGDRLRRVAEYADGIDEHAEADTFREAANELDVIEVYVSDGRELPSHIARMTDNAGREWVRVTI